jgi:prepilin peptidase CpaA
MHTLSLSAFLGFAALAAASDLRARRIPNELVLGGLVAGLALGERGVALGCAGAIVGLAMLLPLFAARWLGGGDVKLLAACGAWLGPTGVLVGGLYGIALGGVLAIAMAVAGGVTREVSRNVGAAVVTLTAPVAPTRRQALVVPLALPLAIGCAIVAVTGGSL